MSDRELTEIINTFLDKEYCSSVYNIDRRGLLNLCREVEQHLMNKFPKWKKTILKCVWSGEIGVNPTRRLFEYEHYTINADKLFKLLPKEGGKDE